MRGVILIAFFLWAAAAAARVADLHAEIRIDRTGELVITERTTVVAPEGRWTSQSSYSASRRISFLADHDTLRWSLKGAERITAEVILPDNVPARQIRAEVSGRDAQVFVRDGRAAFRSIGGVEIAVHFPKGVVVEPGIVERARWIFSDYLGALLLAFTWVLTAVTLLQLRKLSRHKRITARASARTPGY